MSEIGGIVLVSLIGVGLIAHAIWYSLNWRTKELWKIDQWIKERIK